MASVEAADGTRIDYRVTGEGRSLLPVHGITRGAPGEFDGAISAIFDQMAGPLEGALAFDQA